MPHGAPPAILTGMHTPTDPETMRGASRAAGFSWSDAELEAIRPAVDALLGMLAKLDAVEVGEVEPTTQYRML